MTFRCLLYFAENKCWVFWPRAVSVKLIHADVVLHMNSSKITTCHFYSLCYYELNKLECVEIPSLPLWPLRMLGFPAHQMEIKYEIT